MAEGDGGGEPPDKKTTQQNGGTSMDTNRDRESYLYTARDIAPYRVFIEITDKDKRINKFSIGQILRKLARYRNSVTDMKYLGNKKVIVFLNCFIKANLLVGETSLKESGYVAYVPRHLLCITGVINGVPTDMDSLEIKEELESAFPIMDIYRLNKWDKDTNSKTPTNRISVTFRATNLPEKVKLFGINVKVKPYIRKVNFCENCHRFGHKTENCRSKKRCDICSKVHDEKTPNCLGETKCLHCRTKDHRSTDPNCPARQREKSIINMMARKNVTYIEAKELIAPYVSNNMYDVLANIAEYPTPKESFSKITSSNNTNKQQTQQNRNMANRQEPTGSQPQKLAEMKRKKIDENQQNQIPRTQQESNTRGTGLNNNNVTNEKERWEAALRKAQEDAMRKAHEYANRSVQGNLMTFYSTLCQIPGITEETIKQIGEVSKQIFKFDNIMN